MKFNILFCTALLGLSLSYRPAWGVTPFSAGPSDMENDVDTYDPGQFQNDLWNDPNLDGLAPQGNANWPGNAYLAGGPPEFIVGDDWNDIRNGEGNGIIEEVPSGHSQNLGGVPVVAPDGSAHYAVLNFEPGGGPFARTNRQISNPTPSMPFLGMRTGYYATLDVYVDPSIPYAGNNGIPDWWWSNAVNSTVSGTYMTEAPILASVDPSGTTWSFYAGDGNVLLGTVPVGTWVGLEVEPVHKLDDNGLQWQHRLYADGGTHNTLLGSYTTISNAFNTGPGAFSELGGPRYNWFTYPDQNFMVDNGGYLFVDNIGWVAVPEPSAFMLSSLAALSAVMGSMRRRGRL